MPMPCSSLFRDFKFAMVFIVGAIATFPLCVPPFFLPLYARSLGFSLHWRRSSSWVQLRFRSRQNYNWSHGRQARPGQFLVRHTHVERTQYALPMASFLLSGSTGRVRHLEWHGQRWILRHHANCRLKRLRQCSGLSGHGGCRDFLDWRLSYGCSHRRVLTRCLWRRDGRLQSLQAGNILRGRASVAVRLVSGRSSLAHVQKPAQEAVTGCLEPITPRLKQSSPQTAGYETTVAPPAAFQSGRSRLDRSLTCKSDRLKLANLGNPMRCYTAGISCGQQPLVAQSSPWRMGKRQIQIRRFAPRGCLSDPSRTSPGGLTPILTAEGRKAQSSCIGSKPRIRSKTYLAPDVCTDRYIDYGSTIFGQGKLVTF